MLIHMSMNLTIDDLRAIVHDLEKLEQSGLEVTQLKSAGHYIFVQKIMPNWSKGNNPATGNASESPVEFANRLGEIPPEGKYIIRGISLTAPHGRGV